MSDAHPMSFVNSVAVCLLRASSRSRLCRELARRALLPKRVRQFWEWTDEDGKRSDFYRQFVTEGALVFDVGANMGNRSKVFHHLGANVVAVEPQADCARFLRAAFGGKPRFHLVPEALGATPGAATMHISTSSTISSLSADWIESVRRSGRFGSQSWDLTQTVRLDTLDHLIERFGEPVFTKIDVEGYEDHVLAGLSRPVKSLSFEFAPEFMASTMRCIDLLGRLGRYAFQMSLSESMTFCLDRWVTDADIREELSRVDPAAFGDLYVRLEAPHAT